MASAVTNAVPRSLLKNIDPSPLTSKHKEQTKKRSTSIKCSASTWSTAVVITLIAQTNRLGCFPREKRRTERAD